MCTQQNKDWVEIDQLSPLQKDLTFKLCMLRHEKKRRQVN